MRIKKIFTFIFMMLHFIFCYANEEIPNTLITKNPEREVSTVKTERRKEFGEFNIEINKIISKEISGKINPAERQILFDMTTAPVPVLDIDLVYVTEELETFPSVSETNGKKRWSNVMDKYKEAYKNKTPVNNNGLKSEIINKVDEIEGTIKKILKVNYITPPKSLYIGIIDSTNYSLKGMLKYFPEAALFTIKVQNGKGNGTFTEQTFKDMIPAKIDSTKNIVSDFENIKIIKEKNKNAYIDTSGQKYLTLENPDESFMKIENFTEINKIKITDTKGNTSIEINKDGNLAELKLSDNSRFKFKFKTEENKLELSIIPVIFGTTPEANLKFSFIKSNNTEITASNLNLKFPKITHNGITILSKDGTKNSLAPNNTYDIGVEDDTLTENLQINEQQKTYLNGKIGLKAEGKNLQYLFYLLKIDSTFKFEFVSENGDTSINNGDKYTFTDKNDTNNKNQLEFTLDKNQNRLIMKVPYWDLSKIQKTFSLKINSSDNKDLYKVPLNLGLPETEKNEGSILITYYSKYEEEFKSVSEKIDLITPKNNFKYASITVDGEYPYSENLIGAKEYFINEDTIKKDFSQKYDDLALTNLNNIKIQYKCELGSSDGFSIGFKKADWESFLSSKSSGDFSVSVKNYYDLEIGKYHFNISANPKRTATFTINNILDYFVGPVSNEQSINTGKIYGFSNHVPYSEAENKADNVKTGNVFGSVVIGDELRYYGLEDNSQIEIEVDGTKKTHNIANGNDIEVTSNIFIGFVEKKYSTRTISTTEKALYFKLKNYDGKTNLNKTINITILKENEELFRDTVTINVAALENSQTDIEFKIINYDGYIGKQIKVNGDRLVDDSGKVYGSVSTTSGKGEFPIDLTDIVNYDCEYWLQKKDEKKNISNDSISNLKSGKEIIYEDKNKIYKNKIKLMIGDNENFYFEVPEQNMFPYLNMIIKLTFKDSSGNVKKTYQLSFYEVSNPEKNTNTADLDIKIKNIDDYISKYILNDTSNNTLEIRSKTTSLDPNFTYDSNIYDVKYESKFTGAKNIFTIGGTNLNYKFYENTELVASGTGDQSQGKNNPQISTLKEIEFSDGGEIFFGFSRDTNFTDDQKILVKLSEIGDNLYSKEYTYETEIHQLNPTDNSQGITKVSLTVPKIDYSNKEITLNADKKNGLCPKFPYYFGTKDDVLNDGVSDSELSDHATKENLKITGGNIPYLILRSNEIPVTDIGNFIDLESDDGKVTSENGKYTVDYTGGNQLVFEIVGERGDSFTENKIKMTIPKWDETEIKKKLIFKVYNRSRNAHFAIPVNINIGATTTVKNQELQIELNEEYKKIASVFGDRFSFYNKQTTDGKDNFSVKMTDNGENMGKLISESGMFTPVRNTQPDNILLGGTEIEVEADGKTTSLGKGGFFSIEGFKIYLGYDNNSNNKEGRLEMAVDKWTSALNKEFTLRIKNDYGVAIAEYKVKVTGVADAVKDEAIFNFGVLNSAIKYFETTVAKTITLNEVVNDIKIEFSEKNPVLTLAGKDSSAAADDEKLQVLDFAVRYAEKDRIDPTKWNIKISSFIEQITVKNRKKEGHYVCPDPVTMIISIKDSAKGTREIKQ